MKPQKIILVAWAMLLLIGCSFTGDRSKIISMNNPDDEIREVIDRLQQAPFWFDLAQSPVDGSLDAASKSQLEELASSYAAIANHSIDVIRVAERRYMHGASGDKKVLMNRNLNVLNRFLFRIEWPASYPIDPRDGLKILPASPFVNSLETDALKEFDSFAKEYERRIR